MRLTQSVGRVKDIKDDGVENPFIVLEPVEYSVGRGEASEFQVDLGFDPASLETYVISATRAAASTG